MSRWRPPCGACKFLRRRCHVGCIFAPHFCHEEGATQFVAIHRMFGASNVSNLLSRLPPVERYEAARTINFEAQARLRDPIYGCVSDIYALTQQVEILQAKLAILKEQAEAQNNVLNGSAASHTSESTFFGNTTSGMSSSSSTYPSSVHSWLQYEDPGLLTPQIHANNVNVVGDSSPFEIGNGYSGKLEVDNPNEKWDLHAVVFGNNQH